MVHVVAAIIGALVIVAGLIGFVRSLWRSPGRGGGHSDAMGFSDPGTYAGSDHSADSGGHGGADAGGGH